MKDKVNRYLIQGNISEINTMNLYQFSSEHSNVIFDIIACSMIDAYQMVSNLRKLSWIEQEFRVALIKEIDDPLLVWRAKMNIIRNEPIDY